MDFKRKAIVFIITVLSISIVVFNNLTQLGKEIFLPKMNIFLWSAFGFITLGVITFLVWNIRNVQK